MDSGLCLGPRNGFLIPFFGKFFGKWSDDTIFGGLSFPRRILPRGEWGAPLPPARGIKKKRVHNTAFSCGFSRKVGGDFGPREKKTPGGGHQVNLWFGVSRPPWPSPRAARASPVVAGSWGCSVCSEFRAQDVYRCVNGVIVCLGCHAEVDRCPCCGPSMSPGPCRMLERVRVCCVPANACNSVYMPLLLCKQVVVVLAAAAAAAKKNQNFVTRVFCLQLWVSFRLTVVGADAAADSRQLSHGALPPPPQVPVCCSCHGTPNF